MAILYFFVHNSLLFFIEFLQIDFDGLMEGDCVLFTVITIEEEDVQGVSPLKHIISRKTGISLHTEKVMGTTVNFVVLGAKILHKPHRIAWHKLERMVGNSSVILSKRLTLPAKTTTSISCFNARKFSEILALNTSVFLLERCGLPFYNLSLGIVDLSGTRGDLAELAVRHIPHIKIYTLHPERLDAFAKSMLDIYGAVITLSQLSASLEDCCLLTGFDPLPAIEPADPEKIIPDSFPFMVYGCTPPANSLFQSITVSSPAVPPSIAPFIPYDIEPMEFLGALYEQNRCMKLRYCQPQGFFCDGVPCSTDTLCTRIFNMRRSGL